MREYLESFPSDTLQSLPFGGQGSDETKTDQLCSRCKAIDFKKIFAMQGCKIPPYGLPITDFRSDFDPTCLFCSMWLSLLSVTLGVGSRRSLKKSRGCHLRVFDIQVALGMRFRRDLPDPNVVLAAVPGRPITPMQADLMNAVFSKGVRSG